MAINRPPATMPSLEENRDSRTQNQHHNQSPNQNHNQNQNPKKRMRAAIACTNCRVQRSKVPKNPTCLRPAQGILDHVTEILYHIT